MDDMDCILVVYMIRHKFKAFEGFKEFKFDQEKCVKNFNRKSFNAITSLICVPKCVEIYLIDQGP